jgi:hypothetical protein
LRINCTAREEIIANEYAFWLTHFPAALHAKFPTMQVRHGTRTKPNPITVEVPAHTKAASTVKSPSMLVGTSNSTTTKSPSMMMLSNIRDKTSTSVLIGIVAVAAVVIAFIIYQWLDSSAWDSVVESMQELVDDEARPDPEHVKRLLEIIDDLQTRLAIASGEAVGNDM